MITLGLLVLLWSQQAPVLPQDETASMRAIADSGRCSTVAESADERVNPRPAIAPGQPPLLSFRYYEGQVHGRYGNSDLMLDDAGH